MIDWQYNKPDMRTVKDTAENFNLSEYFVRYHLISKGLVRYCKVGRHGKYYINQQSVAAFLDSGYTENENPEQLTGGM